MKPAIPGLLLCAALLMARPACAVEELIETARLPSGEAVPYVLTHQENVEPKYVVVLFPGGMGRIDAHMEDGQIVYRAKGNFLLRARKHLVDNDFAAVATDATSREEHVQALLDDLKTRFPSAKVYLMGTSRGTEDTMALAPYLSERIAGEIHTSSMRSIAQFDSRKYKNRQLVVHHRNDRCHVTPFAAAQWSHDHYGTELIAMEGGESVGDDCEAFAHHGYRGIEKQTIDAIKDWIRKGQ